MSKELREAAEFGVKQWREASPHIAQRKTTIALGLLGAAYLAEHREDDEEPVTEEWLMSLYGDTPWPGFITCGGTRLEWRDGIMVIDTWPIAFAKTRGDVRRLCKVMGIKLKGDE